VGVVAHTERETKDLAIKLIFERSFTILVVKGLVVLAERERESEREREREREIDRDRERVCFVCARGQNSNP
jgi:hypothetical protein